VIMGGPMKGTALASLNLPSLKETRMILALPKEITKPEEPDPCIRCAKCLEACPVGISPAMITLAAEQDLFDVAGEYGANFCIECGNCSYVCPSKRPMLELIRYSRQ
jgi:Na+-translocating ferredoxin:NAD+ oxidoreductase subunit C